MHKIGISLYKYIINLTPEKRTTALLLGMVILFGMVAYFAWKINQKEHAQIIFEKSTKLDTCESRNIRYLIEKESLQLVIYNLKIDSAITSTSNELRIVKELADQVKETENKVKKTTSIINKKLNHLNEK